MCLQRVFILLISAKICKENKLIGLIYDFFENWTKFKSWDNTEKLYKIENWTELKIGQNKKLDKIEKWTKLRLKIRQN